MTFLLILAIIVAVIVLIVIIAFWTTHISQVKEFTDMYGKGSYAKFRVEFKKHEWERSEKYPMSFFCHPSDSEVHAGIIKFEGKGMTLGLWSYLKFCIFINCNRNKKKIKQLVKW